MAQTPYKQLEQEWKRLHAFRGAMAILRWDAAVMMPRGSADVRGEQLAAIETEQHALLTSPKVSRLLERALAGSAGLDDWQRANLREMSRQRDHAIAIILGVEAEPVSIPVDFLWVGWCHEPQISQTVESSR
jgi:carboxypeptidase Taq